MSDSQKEFFQTAYRTGSDIWTHLPYQRVALTMLPDMKPDSIVLDVGTGRGLFAFQLFDLGYRVIGLDYVKSIVDKNNEETLRRGVSDKIRFMEGDALDIPFSKDGFSLVTSVGTLQHITRDAWSAYAHEIQRVLEKEGYYLDISLSRKTPKFYGQSVGENSSGDFEKFGVSYHFFTTDELDEIFNDGFTLIERRVEMFDGKADPDDRIALVFSLYQAV
jgi:ubiquinone/menaquinone biosynthesis C-methylase UbiE